MKILFLLFSFLTVSTSTFAHPVIYKGGLVYQGHFTGESNLQKIGYTVTPKLALELNSSYYELYSKNRDYTIGINYLFKRWLRDKSQGNLYGSLHAGFYHNEINRNLKSVFHAGLMADWESRKLYTAGKVMIKKYETETNYKFEYRFGFAPYVSGMDQLQTWLIGKLSYYEQISRNIEVTPMLRFFYKNVLWEMGSSFNGGMFLTIMVHY